MPNQSLLGWFVPDLLFGSGGTDEIPRSLNGTVNGKNQSRSVCDLTDKVASLTVPLKCLLSQKAHFPKARAIGETVAQKNNTKICGSLSSDQCGRRISHNAPQGLQQLGCIRLGQPARRVSGAPPLDQGWRQRHCDGWEILCDIGLAAYPALGATTGLAANDTSAAIEPYLESVASRSLSELQKMSPNQCSGAGDHAGNLSAPEPPLLGSSSSTLTCHVSLRRSL